MGIYENFSAEVSQKKIKLNYKYLLSGKKLVIEITDFRTYAKKGEMPVYYQYLEPTATRAFAIFKIIVGPGISILLNGFPPEPFEPSFFFPLVEVIRVQDNAMVPKIGSDYNTYRLLGEHQINAPTPPQGKDIGDLKKWMEFSRPPSNFFSIMPLNNGVIIHHHQSNQKLIITVPRLIGDFEFTKFLHPIDAIDADAKYAYTIHNSGTIGAVRSKKTSSLPLLEIIKTPAVKVELSREPHHYTPSNLFFGGQSASRSDIFFAIYETEKIINVPNPGEPITEIKSYWNKVDLQHIPIIQPIVLSPMLSSLDTAVRFIPALGDVLDITEFIKGWHTGRDLYGRKLSSTEVAILGLGALLPFALTGAVRSSRALQRSFSRKADKAAFVLQKLKKSGVNKEDAKVIKETERLIKKGMSPTLAQIKTIQGIYKRTKIEPPTIDELLNVDQTAFVHNELQEAYRAYTKGKSDPANPRAWALGGTRNPQALKLLKGFLGADYIRRAKYRLREPKTFINNFEVPRPHDLSDTEAIQLLNQFFDDGSKLIERLEDIFPKSFTGVEAKEVLKNYSIRQPKISQGFFNVMKGNLAEILSKKIKEKHLKELQFKYPNAKLFSGLTIQLMEKGKLNPAKLFTDDIIAVVENGNLKILMLYEVKSGYRGGMEATEQLFDWIEGRLTHAEGSLLVLKDGRKFTYNPSSTKKGRVLGMNNAPRCIITAKGASHLGIDSSLQIAARTQRIELDLTAEQLEGKLRKELLQPYIEEVARKKQLKEFSDEFLDALESKKIREDFSKEYFKSLAQKKSQDIKVEIFHPPKVEYLDKVTSSQLDYLVAQIFSKVSL